jgi:hypothetical protein
MPPSDEADDDTLDAEGRSCWLGARRGDDPDARTCARSGDCFVVE